MPDLQDIQKKKQRRYSGTQISLNSEQWKAILNNTNSPIA